MLFRKLLNGLRNLLAIIGLFALLVGGYAGLQVAKSYNMPPRLFALKVLNKVGLGAGPLVNWVRPEPIRSLNLVFPTLDSANWQGFGAGAEQVLLPFHYDKNGYPIPYAWSNLQNLPTKAEIPTGKTVLVADAKGFLGALRKSEAGHVITLQAGSYQLKGHSINLGGAGTATQPIIVRAEVLGEVFLELDTLDGFMVDQPFWVFENLDIKGVSKNHSYGEHAFHVVGQGKGFVLRNSRVHEFNAMIKANGVPHGSERIFPDGALIEGNSFFNSGPRQTSNPVTFIDVVGANYWIIRGNLLADFEKAQGDRTSYGAFLKGNSAFGVFENNLVIGEYRTTGGVRVGLSMGGGGTGAQYSRNRSDEVEHSSGIVRNNIVMYCSDVGLYLNKAKATQVFNNTFYRTVGIDVRFPTSSAVIKNNLLTGRIKNRDGGQSVEEDNLFAESSWLPGFMSASFDDWFVNPEQGNFALKNGARIIDQGLPAAIIQEDFCGTPRDSRPDIGAIEYRKEQPACTPLPQQPLSKSQQSGT